jgi:hypothetical protein
MMVFGDDLAWFAYLRNDLHLYGAAALHDTYLAAGAPQTPDEASQSPKG